MIDHRTKDYTVISGSTVDILAYNVRQKLREHEEWELVGSVLYADGRFFQAMARVEYV